MIYNEEAYYTGYYRNVRALGAIPALVFDTICGLMRTNETGGIANSTLCDFLGCTKPTLLNAIDKLQAKGYITRTNGDGRGNKTVYVLTEKGKESCPFMDEKGSKNFTKRVKNFNEKGKEILPINKDVNKELKESDGDMRETQSPSTFNTTPQNFENMEDFNLFWNLYPGAPEWEHEKENCERVWFTLSEEWRKNLIDQLQKGLRWRVRENDNPYWYLKNYNGEIVHAELPFVRNGSKQIARWHNAGEQVCVIMYDGSVAYCLERDLEVMKSAGAEFLRNF